MCRYMVCNTFLEFLEELKNRVLYSLSRFKNSILFYRESFYLACTLWGLTFSASYLILENN